MNGQNEVIKTTAVEFVLLAGAAASSAKTWIVRINEHDVYFSFGLSAVLLLVALLVRFRRARSHAQERWFFGRATAESVKTLAWRFAVRSDPIRSTLGEEAAERETADRMRGVVTVHHQAIASNDGSISQESGQPWISEWMRTLRSLPLQSRVESYLTHRLRGQIDWYKSNASANRIRQRVYGLIGTAVLLMGLLGAVFATLGMISIDVLGASAAIVASIQGWQHLKQYKNLSLSYAVAASDLESALERLGNVRDETTWAALVNDTEEAISREHTSWLATRHV